jgi:SpoVK/Ycf46/Vps4 family AAA+-type ATPase
LCAGCATRQPTPEITRAQTLIEQAEKAGAQQYAAAELDSARDKLRLASAAADHGKDDEARARANEAAADAELAQSRAASSTAKKAASEVERSTDTLEREAERQQSTGVPPVNQQGTGVAPAPVPPTP